MTRYTTEGQVEIRLDPSKSQADKEGTNGVKPSEAVSIGGDTVQEQRVDRKVTGVAWVALVISVLTSTFLYALDNTILANIRPVIIHDLGQIEKLAWISVAYALAETSMNPTWGKLYGCYDNKLLYCLSVVIFDVGSAICGAAPNMNALIVGRVVAGAGGSGIYIGTLNILSAMTEVQERALYINIVGIAWCFGTILGPIIGGAFADSTATWRWAFYVNLCISAIAAPIYLYLLPRNPSGIKGSRLERLKKIDITGMLLFVGAALTLIMSIAFGGQLLPWNSGSVIALLVLTVLFWISFAIQQSWSYLTTPEDRIFPIHFVKDGEMCLLFAETSIGITCIVIPIYFLPLFFQFVRNSDALASGVKILPHICAVVVGCLLNGALFEKTSVYLYWFLSGASLALIGAGLLTTLSPSIQDAHIFGFSILVGLGSGSFAQLAYAVGQGIQPASHQAQVVAFISCAQMIGLALAIGIGTSIFTNQATTGIRAILFNTGVSDQDIRAAIAGTGSQLLQNVDQATRNAILAVLTGALRDVFIMTAVVAGCGIILSLLLRRVRLFGTPSEKARGA